MMTKVKAKDKIDWNIWHYGILEGTGIVRTEDRSVEVVDRTVCEDTGLKCKGQSVYENDWLEIMGNGEPHKFLVVWKGDEFRAAEDEEFTYDLREIVNDSSCKIVGNLYG